MTKNKRFKNNGTLIFDNKTPLNAFEVVDKLNELHEENKELKKENAQFDILIKNNQLAYIDLEKENEQLKSFVEYEKRQHKHWKRECLENIKEIAQLKREIVQLRSDDGMTEKRFQINNNMGFEDKIETFELSCVVDMDNKTFYFIIDDLANVKAFVERLNKLNDENEQLKQQIQTILKLTKKIEDCTYDIKIISDFE